MNNPVPILHQHFGLTPKTLVRVMGVNDHHGNLNRFFTQDEITTRDWDRLRDYTLTEWGQCESSQVRSLLWRCYYPNHLPNIFHILHYRAQEPVEHIASQSRIAVKTVRKNLIRARVPERQVKRVAAFASRVEEAMRSPKTWDGVNPIYMEIHRALRDRSRVFAWGETYDED